MVFKVTLITSFGRNGLDSKDIRQLKYNLLEMTQQPLTQQNYYHYGSLNNIPYYSPFPPLLNLINTRNTWLKDELDGESAL